MHSFIPDVKGYAAAYDACDICGVALAEEKEAGSEETAACLDTIRVCSIRIEFGAEQEFAFWHGTYAIAIAVSLVIGLDQNSTKMGWIYI